MPATNDSGTGKRNTDATLTLGSLFDGSGGFPLGGLLAGIQPVWASEIEPFPIRVTTKRLPFMKHLGDISAVNGAKITPVDIITFGSPCTDMSVAGKRAGLCGSQSSLFYEAIRIVKEMRCATNDGYPKYIVWENVQGAFSSNHGEDLRFVLESICRIADEAISIPEPPKGKWTNAGSIVGDGFSVAWRLLDAQYWGVPQRRKRIYLCGFILGIFRSKQILADILQARKRSCKAEKLLHGLFIRQIAQLALEIIVGITRLLFCRLYANITLPQGVIKKRRAAT